jgi:hypothetical protein
MLLFLKSKSITSGGKSNKLREVVFIFGEEVSKRREERRVRKEERGKKREERRERKEERKRGKKREERREILMLFKFNSKAKFSFLSFAIFSCHK